MRPNIPFSISNIFDEFQEGIKTLEQRLLALGRYATPDFSSYAPGRERLWLGSEPDLGGRQPPKPAHPLSVPTKQLLVQMVGDFDFCLVTWSYPGRHIGITPHGDAGYADWTGRGLNVCGRAEFKWWQSWGLQKSGAAATERHILLPGDFVSFGCKEPHSAMPFGDSVRINLNFWNAKGTEVWR